MISTVEQSRHCATMAELLGIVAAAVALVDLSARLTKRLPALHSGLSNSQGIVNDLQAQLHSLSSICEILKDQQGTLKLESIPCLTLLRQSLEECLGSVKNVHVILDKLAVKPFDGKIKRAGKAFDFVRSEDELKRRIATLTGARANLHLALSLTSL